MKTNTGITYCPVCSSAKVEKWSDARDYEYFSVTSVYHYYECKNCGSIFIFPLPIHELKTIYPPNYYSFVTKGKNVVTSIKEWLDKIYFRKILKKVQGNNLNILDVGGGTGWLLDQLKKCDARVAFTQVVDIDDQASAIAEKNGHSYFCGTIETFETENKFDLVLLLNLIEHVADPLAVLKKCESLLNENGLILIKTPNTKSLDARLFKKSYWGGLHCPRHWVIFSEKSFRLMISQTSLIINKLKYTQGAPFWSFSIIAALNRKKMVSVSAKKPIIFHWLFAPLSAVFALFDFIRSPFAKTSQMFIELQRKNK